MIILWSAKLQSDNTLLNIIEDVDAPFGYRQVTIHQTDTFQYGQYVSFN